MVAVTICKLGMIDGIASLIDEDAIFETDTIQFMESVGPANILRMIFGHHDILLAFASCQR